MLDAFAVAAIERGHTDVPYLIAADKNVKTQFIASRDELKIAGVPEIALMEFTMRNGQVMNLLAESAEHKADDP